MAEATIRKNADGSVFTWPAHCKVSGVDVVVDDQTFDPEKHESIAPEDEKSARASATGDTADDSTKADASDAVE